MPVVCRFLLLLATGVLSACASVPIDHARDAYERGDYEQAAEILSGDKIRNRDKLLALMEQGSIWHEAGDYTRSKDALLAASGLLQSTDFISVTEKTASLTINDRTTTYRGETAERLWIHTYQIMNFLLLGEYEGAAVEARQALKLLDKHAEELDHDYFSRALLGAAFDSVRLYNSAYIEYRKLSELLPANDVANELYRDRARKSGIPVNANATAGNTTPSWVSDNQSGGELVVFVATGKIPEKVAGNIFLYPGERISFPVYDVNRFLAPDLNLTVQASNTELAPGAAGVITTDLGSVARKALAARGTRIAANHIARSGIKHALVNAAEDESESAAAILDLIFFLLEEADTRAWTTLPGHLSLLRIPLSSGTHSVTVRDSRSYGPINSSTLENVVITPGSRIYRKVRL